VVRSLFDDWDGEVYWFCVAGFCVKEYSLRKSLCGCFAVKNFFCGDACLSFLMYDFVKIGNGGNNENVNL
jgi:hypothetical protein